MIPKDVLNDFDQVVMGEAENIILNLLSGKIKDKVVQVERPQNLDDLPNIFDDKKFYQDRNLFFNLWIIFKNIAGFNLYFFISSGK